MLSSYLVESVLTGYYVQGVYKKDIVQLKRFIKTPTKIIHFLFSALFFSSPLVTMFIKRFIYQPIINSESCHKKLAYFKPITVQIIPL